MDFVYLACCVLAAFGFYMMGRADGELRGIDAEEARIEIEKHRIDKHYEHERWLAERGERHEG